MAYEDQNDQLAGRSMAPSQLANSEWHGSPIIPGSVRHREDSIDLTQLWGMVRDNAKTRRWWSRSPPSCSSRSWPIA